MVAGGELSLGPLDLDYKNFVSCVVCRRRVVQE